MEIYILTATAIIIVFLFLLIRSRSKSNMHGSEELNQLKSENERLIISLAKAQERAENLKSEQEYLKNELNVEREKLSDAMQALEGSRSYLQSTTGKN